MNVVFRNTILLAYFAYFLTFLTGHPDSRVEFVEQQRNGSGYTVTVDDSFPEEIRQEIKSVREPGLIERIWIEKKGLESFQDTLLESDAKPENLFRDIERSYSRDLFFALLNVLWCFLFLLLIAAGVKQHWFFPLMLRLVFIPSALFVFFNLITVQREKLIYVGFYPAILIQIGIETLLLFGAIQVVISTFLSRPPAVTAPFMNHLKKEKRSGASFGAITLYHIAMVFVAALLLSNVILLPLYALQMKEPGVFVLLILTALASLAVFYTTSYVRVTRAQEGEGSPLSGFVFLGFRFLRNGFFLTGSALLILFTIGMIVLIAILNIDVLQWADLLKKSRTM